MLWILAEKDSYFFAKTENTDYGLEKVVITICEILIA